MPYGYENYRLSKGISPNTTYVEVRLIRSFLAHVDTKYKRSVEPREILPADIKSFIAEQRENGLKEGTIIRKLGTIKSWFDYLWQIGKIEQDFMPKIKVSSNLDNERSDIEIDYQYLLSKKSQVIHSPKLGLYAKMLYLLYMRGFRLRDIVSIKINSIQDQGDSLLISIIKKNNYKQQAIYTNEDISVILSCIEKAIFRGTEFLLSSKVNNEYIPLKLGSIKDHISSLKEELGCPFRSEQIRLAYVHYLYTTERKTLEDIQAILGMPLTSVTKTLKEALERVKQVDYN